jgi:hypothetical protein
MPFVRRNSSGNIIAMSVQPLDGFELVEENDTDLAAFELRLVAAHDRLRESDREVVRVLDDLINVLIEKNTIRFTDLPDAAQKKLLERRGLREAGAHLGLLKDDPPLV